VNDLGDLMKDVFFRLMDMSGRVFIHVRYSEAVSVGRRGFLPEENTRLNSERSLPSLEFLRQGAEKRLRRSGARET
jgi:hypothetical protein